jgi:hypothetical protein
MIHHVQSTPKTSSPTLMVADMHLLPSQIEATAAITYLEFRILSLCPPGASGSPVRQVLKGFRTPSPLSMSDSDPANHDFTPSPQPVRATKHLVKRHLRARAGLQPRVTCAQCRGTTVRPCQAARGPASSGAVSSGLAAPSGPRPTFRVSRHAACRLQLRMSRLERSCVHGAADGVD